VPSRSQAGEYAACRICRRGLSEGEIFAGKYRIGKIVGAGAMGTVAPEMAVRIFALSFSRDGNTSRFNEDFSNDPRMTPPLLNIDVFRIRGQFAAAGVVDAADILERRPPSRQLRIGTGRLTIETL
jgi:hypothetical protein